MIGKAALFELAKTLGGLPVLGCLDNSPAARAGLRYGDILLEMNGIRIARVEDYVTARCLRDDGMDIVIFRDGREWRLTLEFDSGAKSIDATELLSQVISKRIDAVMAAPGPVTSFDKAS